MSVLKGQEAQSAMKSLRAMIPADELNHIQPSGPPAIYTTLATAWMMILLRLGGGMSMQAVVKDAIEHAPNIFPDNKRVRAASLSTRDTAFSDARGRLRIDTLRYLLNLDGNGPGESYSVTWKATKKNLTTHSHIPANAELDVVVHTVPLSEVIPGCCTAKLLHVVTTPDISREETVALYLKRYDVEHDIRDVKVTLKTERIRAHSSSMFEKELLTSLVAYNLVVQFRREAAARAGVPPRRLSFTGVWNTFQSYFLKLSPASTSEEWETRYERALAAASKDLVRVRPGRSYARQAHPRRSKTTKFQKSQRKTQKPKPTPT